ncbi:copper chaperone PCu(A)C [Alteromonas sp. S015]|uniref:copper chaperone PCu(A)C n=1 Tax=Alteromonas sp. S015 TaxID=3117401 RepID=UPI002FE37337
MSLFTQSLKPLVIATGLFSLGLSGLFAVHATEHDNHHQHERHQERVNKQADIMVMNGYARATFALAKTGAVYFTLHNHSDSDKTLTSVSVSSDVASEAQIHTTVMEEDVMKMRELTDGVKIKAGEMVSFESGGHHIMLMGLTKGLEEGSEVALILTFSDASELQVSLPVKKEAGEAHHYHH